MAYSSSCRGILLFLLAAAVLVAGDGGGVGFDLHHRFSPVVKRWAESRGRPAAAAWWPEGSPEYYSALSAHDRARRVLAGGKGESLLSFADGNSTTRHAGSYAPLFLLLPLFSSSALLSHAPLIDSIDLLDSIHGRSNWS